MWGRTAMQLQAHLAPMAALGEGVVRSLGMEASTSGRAGPALRGLASMWQASPPRPRGSCIAPALLASSTLAGAACTPDSTLQLTQQRALASDSSVGHSSAGQQQQQQQHASRGEGEEDEGESSSGRDPIQLFSHSAPLFKYKGVSFGAKTKDEEDARAMELFMTFKERFQESNLPEFMRSLMFTHIWDNVLVDVRRSVKVTKSMKIETFSAMVASGNGKGLFGIGQSSSSTVQQAIMDAFIKSYENLQPIPRYREHTIYHRLDHELHKVRLMMLPRRAGFGITSNDMMYEICQLIGIKDITIKVSGRRSNKFNVMKCVVEALQKQSTPHEGVEGTGVYVRERYMSRLPMGLKRGVDVP